MNSAISVLIKLHDMCVAGGHKMIGLSPEYRVHMFNENTHFARHKEMPLTFEVNKLMNEDGRNEVWSKFLKLQSYYYGFCEATRCFGADDGLASILCPDYGIVLSFKEEDSDIPSDYKKALDYFSTYSYFNVRMVADIAYAVLYDAVGSDIIEALTCPALVSNNMCNKPVDICESVDGDEIKDIFDFVYFMYMNDMVLRSD